MNEIIKQAIVRHKEALGLLEASQEKILKISSLCVEALKNKGKIILMGNGGSASDAQHLAAEFVGRFKKQRVPLAAIALSVNTSILTAIGNDFGFEEVFSRQIEALAEPRDLVIGISTSGKSKNVIKAVAKAKELGIVTIGFLGNDGGDLKSMVDVSLIIPFSDTPSIQEMHILAGHIVCEIVDEHFSQKTGNRK